MILWAAIGVACSTAISVVLFLFTVLSPPEVAIASSRMSMSVPRRPNPYLYLDKILATTTQTFPPITNFPPVVLQFDNANPKRPMREEERGRLTEFGTVYPDDRHILITNKVRRFNQSDLVADDLTMGQVSTVVQFRHLDYAMERCVLNITIPQPDGHFDPAVKLTNPSMIDVWVLDSLTEFSRYITGSMGNAPSRRELLTTLIVFWSESSHSSAFHCESGEFTTLELVCAPSDPHCSVDFWQDQRAKPIGGQSGIPRNQLTLPLTRPRSAHRSAFHVASHDRWERMMLREQWHHRRYSPIIV